MIFPLMKAKKKMKNVMLTMVIMITINMLLKCDASDILPPLSYTLEFSHNVRVLKEEYPITLPYNVVNMTLVVDELYLKKMNRMDLVDTGSNFSLIFPVNFEEYGWNATAMTFQQISFIRERNKNNKIVKEIRTYFASFNATSFIGVHSLQWGNNKAKIMPTFLEVSCSNGIKCDGEERFVNVIDPQTGKTSLMCRPSYKPLCDDETECTIDSCDEKSGLCKNVIDPLQAGKKCPKCGGKQCKPKCPLKRGKCECGPTGCGTSFGECANGLTCISGKCSSAVFPGMCSDPVNLNPMLAAKNYSGIFEITGDTSKGVDIVRPKCNPISLAGEIMHLISLPKTAPPTGMDARVTHISGKAAALDTVLQLIEVNPLDYPNGTAKGCIEASINPDLVAVCADDTSPPGGLSSRVSWVLKPGYDYYVHVDGFSAKDVGKFKLVLTLTPRCAMRCDGKKCGDSGCGALYPCGTCASGLVCSAQNECVPEPCKPKCKGRTCGSDGCGGTCGSCDEENGFLCSETSGKCLNVGICDNLLPVCTHKKRIGNNKFITVEGCDVNEWCGSDCKCHDENEPLMDLFVDLSQMSKQQVVVDDFLVEDTSCALVEGCFNSPGLRRIYRFPTDVGNQGMMPFDPPSPPENYPNLFTWGACHGHWHFDGFAEFFLYSEDMQTLVRSGGKRSYCAEDAHQYAEHPNAPCLQQYTCDRQGVSRGWVDSYVADLDCQFIDITGLPGGRYVLKQCTNVGRYYPEALISNNCAFWNVTIPAPPLPPAP